MGKKLISGTVVIFLFSIGLSYLPIDITLNSAFYNTLFTVIGIFYSIGYSIALGFDYSKIDNKKFAIDIRDEVKHVMHSFTFSLSIAVILFIVTNFFIKDNSCSVLYQKGFFKFSCNAFFAVVLVYILIYLVYNFFRLQNLKEDLDDKIREDNEK